ncbi:hypothetical protein, partial [Escherichia coli]|uniref:hypothetical protein n=1 Tax=Escherichia coli TaxID=562 RepID=UPI001BAF3968
EIINGKKANILKILIDSVYLSPTPYLIIIGESMHRSNEPENEMNNTPLNDFFRRFILFA